MVTPQHILMFNRNCFPSSDSVGISVLGWIYSQTLRKKLLSTIFSTTSCLIFLHKGTHGFKIEIIYFNIHRQHLIISSRCTHTGSVDVSKANVKKPHGSSVFCLTGLIISLCMLILVHCVNCVCVHAYVWVGVHKTDLDFVH